MKLKKYNQFVNEELTPFANEIESQEILDAPEEEIENTEVENTEIEKEEPKEVVSMNVEEEEEEEGSHYHGTLKMKELAQKLGAEIVNNEINFDGKKVNFYSEDEKFHIDNKKFDSVEDAFDYLTGE